MFVKWLLAGILTIASAFSVAGEQSAHRHGDGKKSVVTAQAGKAAVKKTAKNTTVRKHVRHAKQTSGAKTHNKLHAKRGVKNTKVARHGRKSANRYLAQRSDGSLFLMSSMALVVNQEDGSTIYAKRPAVRSPIASLTKLMTAMVTLDANLPMDEPVTVTEADVDTLRGSSSRLPVGATLSREDMLHLALMASENRAASALARHYPGGRHAFVDAMNRKADELGMRQSWFSDPTGLRTENLSTAQDLVKMVKAAYQYPMIRRFSTSESHEVVFGGHSYPVPFRNTNALVKSENWDIGLSKTGYINEAGRCLVMQARIAQQPVIIVLLDAQGTYTRIGDANRVKKWIETKALRAAVQAAKVG